MKKRVLFITNVPSPYRVLFFNELSKYCDLTVVYEKKHASDRDEKWCEESLNYKIVYLNGLNTNSDSAYSRKIKKILKNEIFDFIYFCNFSSLTGITGIRYCTRHKIPYFLEGDGAFYQKKIIKDILKRKIISGAEYCFSTCKNLDEYFVKLGAKKKRIIRYHFSSHLDDDLKSNKNLINDKMSLRQKLGFSYDKIILSVGQFIHRKGFDLLIESARNIPGALFVIVGGEPPKEYIDLSNGLNNIKFVSFKTKQELSEYYAAADLFVLPTREDIWGLVVNEALSFGLPVITTNRCNAGLELIKADFNGVIINVDDLESLTNNIKKFLSYDLSSLKENCLNSIKEYSIDQMVKDHMDFINNYGKEKNSNN